MKKLIFTLLLLIAGWQATQAQEWNMYKALNDSAYQTMADYQAGNKYQKDAILFMDMVADTHPYYIKPERRADWFAKKPALMEKCKTIETDEDFADALNEVLGKQKDKHTSVTTKKQYQEALIAERKKLKESGITSFAPDREHIMRPHATVYDYQIFPEPSICYLQFNKCTENQADPFATFLNRMFAEMEEGNINTLVVDVQYNNGGSDRYWNMLIEHLYPIRKIKPFTAYLRFSDFMTAYYPNVEAMKKNWEREGHKDELFQQPAGNIPDGYEQPKLYEGQVVFVMGTKTFSSAGNLITIARDNHIGTIIGTTSTFGPSHYGNVLPFRLPNTDVYGSISSQFFVRPDESKSDELFMQPDIEVNLDDKDAAWQFIVEKYGKSDK